jgi:hypothetical protein
MSVVDGLLMGYEVEHLVLASFHQRASVGSTEASDDRLARVGRIDRSTFVPCSRLVAILYACHPLDSEREVKLPDLRTGYFTVLMCAKEMPVWLTAPQDAHRRPLPRSIHASNSAPGPNLRPSHRRESGR